MDQGKVKAEAFSKRFKQENIIPQENPKVNEWMSNITADKKGYVNTNIYIIQDDFIFINFIVNVILIYTTFQFDKPILLVWID